MPTARVVFFRCPCCYRSAHFAAALQPTSFGAHGKRLHLSAGSKRSLSRHPRLLFAPLTPIRCSQPSQYILRGQTAAYCCARLLVARANRAVIVFAMFRSVFCPTLFSGCGRVRFIPQSSICSHHH